MRADFLLASSFSSTFWATLVLACAAATLYFFLLAPVRAPNANKSTAPPEALRRSSAATPPVSPLGPAVVCSTFCVDGKGRISEPDPPRCNRLKLPFDLSQRGLASAATAEAHLAVKLLNLEVGEVMQSLDQWHDERGTRGPWEAARRGVSLVARRSTLIQLWGHGGAGGVVRARRRKGVVTLDPAYRAVDAARKRGPSSKTGYGRRFEVALTQQRSGKSSLGESCHLATAFFASVIVDIASHTMLLLTEVDAVEPGSWLASPEELPGGPTGGGVGILEAKCRTCPPQSREFALHVAKGVWAQCCLGAVEEAVIGVRAGSKIVALQRMSQGDLVSAAQREDACWSPEAALRCLEERIGFVLSQVGEGDDYLVAERGGRLQVQDRASGATVAVSEELGVAVAGVS